MFVVYNKLRDIKEEDIEEVSIVNYVDYWQTIYFTITPKSGPKLIAFYIITMNRDSIYCNIRLLMNDFTRHRKLYSKFQIKKILIDKPNVKFMYIWETEICHLNSRVQNNIIQIITW